jgi:hypothetical protein
MKKVLAWIVLISFFGWGFYNIIDSLIIQPCINFYTKYGYAGVFTWLFVVIVIILAVVCLAKILNWAIDNA